MQLSPKTWFEIQSLYCNCDVFCVSRYPVLYCMCICVLMCTLENLCTRTLQSSRGGCSRRVHKTVSQAVKKGNIVVNILLLKIFIANYCHLLIQLCICSTRFLRVELWSLQRHSYAKKYDFILKTSKREIFAYVVEFMLTLAKMQNYSTLM